jgi:hypothetical protein
MHDFQLSIDCLLDILTMNVVTNSYLYRAQDKLRKVQGISDYTVMQSIARLSPESLQLQALVKSDRKLSHVRKVREVVCV